MLYMGYLAGYSDAMSWRDPKEELPEDVGLYLCKCEKKLGFYFDIVFFNKVWRSDNVIGWRPIENKNHFEGRIEEAGCDFCRDEHGYTIGNMYVCDKCGRQVP